VEHDPSSVFPPDDGSFVEASKPEMAVPQAKTRERPMSARPPPPKLKSATTTVEEPATYFTIINSRYVAIHTEDNGHDDDDFIVKTVEDEPAATEVPIFSLTIDSRKQPTYRGTKAWRSCF
jgi:hypothetical protein